MASLQPAFVPDGKVTAGNSSQIVDGTAALLVASERKASELGLEPRARFLGFGVVGVDPHLMLHGNPEACERALAKSGLTWDDMEVIEVNEAFASVVLQFLADTGLRERWEAGDVNPNGGGISLGHPLGATGARITATLVSELERRNARYGIAAMCIGFGQAIAGVVERLRRRGLPARATSCAARSRASRRRARRHRLGQCHERLDRGAARGVDLRADERLGDPAAARAGCDDEVLVVEDRVAGEVLQDRVADHAIAGERHGGQVEADERAAELVEPATPTRFSRTPPR